MRIVVLASLFGCTGASLSGPPCAVERVTGSLAGVTLAIRSDTCVYKRGEPARFTYEVATDAAVPALLVPSSGGGCSSCQQYSTDPSSWVRWTIGGTAPTGVDQTYCVCDVGCCAPTQEQTIQPALTTASGTIDWSGRIWTGPSDTGNPQGDFFLPGSYTVRVTFNGYAFGEVHAELPIDVTP